MVFTDIQFNSKLFSFGIDHNFDICLNIIC